MEIKQEVVGTKKGKSYSWGCKCKKLVFLAGWFDVEDGVGKVPSTIMTISSNYWALKRYIMEYGGGWCSGFMEENVRRIVNIIDYKGGLTSYNG